MVAWSNFKCSAGAESPRNLQKYMCFYCWYTLFKTFHRSGQYPCPIKSAKGKFERSVLNDIENFILILLLTKLCVDVLFCSAGNNQKTKKPKNNNASRTPDSQTELHNYNLSLTPKQRREKFSKLHIAMHANVLICTLSTLVY